MTTVDLAPLRAMLDHHVLGDVHPPTWAGTEPVDGDAWCVCGAPWVDDGCELAASLIEATNGNPAGLEDAIRADERRRVAGDAKALLADPAALEGWLDTAEIRDEVIRRAAYPILTEFASWQHAFAENLDDMAGACDKAAEDGCPCSLRYGHPEPCEFTR